MTDTDNHVIRELRFRLRMANKTMGRQGQTIANLRGELARVREEHSKLDRHELRRLERENATGREAARLVLEENARLRDKIDAITNSPLPTKEGNK